MTHPGCYMRPLVEPLRDGRLDEIQRVSIEQHLRGCDGCQAHQRQLARLASLASAAPTEEACLASLDHRRGRMRLLQAAALLDGAPERSTLGGLCAVVIPPRAAWSRPLGAVAVAALVVVAAGRWNRSSDSPAAARTPAAPQEPPKPPVTMVEPPSTTTATLDPAVALGDLNGPGTSPRQRPPARREVTPVKVQERAVAARDPAPEAFAAGVGSMEQGNFGEAIERLGAFRKHHPGDLRAEDAAFLVIVALQRAGRHQAAAAAARDYLASYPTGYRRGEAQRILAHAD